MRKYFVITDTHSFYKETKKALDKAGFQKQNPDHYVIHCGDVMDRGNESKQMLNFLWYLYKRNRVILIKGNHEDLFEKMLRKSYYSYVDVSNGTVKTIGDLCNPPLNAAFEFNAAKQGYNKKWDILRAAMVNFFELDSYIFVHGWIPVKQPEFDKYIYDPEWRKASNGDWALARWDNGMELSMKGILEPGKTIVCGHWHASYGNILKKLGYPDTSKQTLAEHESMKRMSFEDPELFKPYVSEGIIALDACTAITKFCNCLVLTVDDNGKIIDQQY